MAKRHYTVRGNFPRQKADLVETIEAGSWPAALGQAARAMKLRLKGHRIKVASFTIEQVEVATAATVPAEQPILVPPIEEASSAAPGETPGPTGS